MIGKCFTENGLLILDLGEAGFLCISKLGTAQTKVAQGIFNNLLLRRTELGKFRTILNNFKFIVEC